MKIDVLTLFPEMFSALNVSVIKRGMDKNLFQVDIHNIRDYTEDKHKKCDDYPFGGGAGMVMMVQPIVSAIASIDPEHKAKRIFLSPKGETFCHKKAVEYSKEDKLLFLCGHYEGVDQRAIDMCIDEELSIGDYVLTGGELACMVVIDSLARQIPDVIDDLSLCDESFTGDLLEYPQYTRPSVFQGVEVPQILLNGNHGEIDKWRLQQQIKATKERRPDLYKKYIEEEK